MLQNVSILDFENHYGFRMKTDKNRERSFVLKT